MSLTQAQQSRELKRNEEKWTPTLIEAGWTVIPSIILEKQHALGLDPIDVNILFHLAKHWWYQDNPPHPSKASLAKCMNVNVSTIRRHIARMEKDGFIRREPRYNKKSGQQTNIYHFDGLIKAATPHALEFLALRAKQREEDEARRTRKKAKPVLIVDNTTATQLVN